MRSIEWTDDQLAQAIAESTSWSATVLALGYRTRGGNPERRARRRAAELGITTEHFHPPRASQTPEAKRAYERAWYASNPVRKETLRQQSRDRVDRNFAFIVAYLEDHPCVECGATDIRVLDFDHLPEFEKDTEVMTLVRHGASVARLEAEIAKCEVVCANDHRIRTAERDGRWRKVDLGTLARKVGVSKSYLSMIETGQRSPSPQVCSALAKSLKVAIADLR